MARDISDAQFLKWIAADGWHPHPSFLPYFFHDDFPGVQIGAVVDAKTYKIDRRATVAHLRAEWRRLRKRHDKVVQNLYPPNGGIHGGTNS